MSEPSAAALKAQVEALPRQLVGFFYLLLRDRLSAGSVEELVVEAEKLTSTRADYSNPWVAAYAIEISERLTRISDRGEPGQLAEKLREVLEP